MEAFSCILFDFEGVLFDPHKIMGEAYRIALRNCLEDVPHLNEIEKHIVLSPSAVIKKLQAKNPSRVLSEYEKIYMILAKDPKYIVVYDNVLSTLKTLAQHGVKIGIVTSQKRERFIEIATQANILPFADVTITPSDCGLSRMKPNPYGIEMALHKVGKNATDSAFVGDSPEDIIAAKRANVFSVGALWGLHPQYTLVALKPDCLCNKIEDILSIKRT